jgi:large subunit ribosomal protein L24
MQRIKKGDEVIVIAGKDKGRRGAVLRVQEDGNVVVENVNVARKHQRPNPTAGVAGGIVEQEKPLHPSNVLLWNPTAQKGDRIGFRQLTNGRKVRFFKSNGEVLDT